MIPEKKELQGKVALITGGARRLGRAIALALAAEGVHGIIHYANSPDEAEETAAALRREGVNAWTIQADLADPRQAENLINRCQETTGKAIDILINNASIFPSGTLMEFTAEDLANNMQVNAMAPLQISRALARVSQSGSIINLLDSRMEDYDAAHVAYHLSKRALFALTRMLATELAPRFRANAVAPGLILPPAGKSDDFLKNLAGTNPLGTVGNVRQVTNAVLYLLKAWFVTGQVIYVDGGRHMKGAFYG